MQHKFLTTAEDPLAAIEAAAYKGQPEKNKKYRPGFETYLDHMPGLCPCGTVNDLKVTYSIGVMDQLAARIMGEDWVTNQLADNEFERTILAIAPQYERKGKLHSGQEIIVAEWGKGYTSPIHGHNGGLLYERILNGTMVITTYRIVDKENRIVRIQESKLYNADNPVILEKYFIPLQVEDQSIHVHSLRAATPAKSLHFIAEHSADGMGNAFTLEEFVAYGMDDFMPVKMSQVKKGDVLLIRSNTSPEFADHFAYVTGDKLEHNVLEAGHHATTVLDYYNVGEEKLYLRMNEEVRDTFVEFHALPEVISKKKSFFDMLAGVLWMGYM